jgi:hypothetical protein
MIADYNSVLPRFLKDVKKQIPRSEWCKVSLYERAKTAEQQWREQMAADGVKDNGISLYSTFFIGKPPRCTIWT